MTQPRVVVTGFGVVSPVGLDLESTWASLVAGRSGIAPITRFDASGLDVRIGGEVRGFDPTRFMEPKEARRTDRFTQFALAATDEAVRMAGLVADGAASHEVGVIVGAAVGGVWTYNREVEVLARRGARAVSPFLIPSISVDALGVQIALRHGFRGPNHAVSSACSSGSDAIGAALDTIRRGDARVMLTGGSEAAVTPIAMAAFSRMRALSRRNDEPECACRPFDADRDGFVMAEGAAILVLEDLASAVARGAEPLVELASYAATADAAHLTSPDASGESAGRCIRRAMERANVAPEELSYINAHGTGTSTGDPIEARAIRLAFGEQADRVPVSATKSMTGHLLGASGAIEALIAAQAVRSDVIPPTINLDHPDPSCELNLVANRRLEAPVDVAISTSFGFGGHNSCLVLRKLRSC